MHCLCYVLNPGPEGRREGGGGVVIAHARILRMLIDS